MSSDDTRQTRIFRRSPVKQLTLAAFGLWIMPMGLTMARQEAGAPAPAGGRPPRLYTKPIVLADCPIQPLHDVKVSVQQLGVLVEFPVKEGMRVKKGEKLGRIEDGLAKIEVERTTLAANSEAGRRAAMAAEKDAAAKLASAKVLFDRRQMSEEQFRETQAALEIAKERVNDAISKHDQDVVEMKGAVEKLRLHTVASPCDGVVVEKFKQEGESVQGQDPTVLRLIQTDIVKVKAPVNIRDARLLRKGMEVEVFPNRPTGERQRLLSHTGPVTCVKAMFDGMHCASAGADGRIVIWNLQTGRQENILSTGEQSVNGIALTPANPNALVSVGADRKIQVWDWTTGKLTKSIDSKVSRDIMCVAMHPRDPNLCITGDQDRLVRVWNLQTGAEVNRMEGHSAFVLSIAITPDGKHAVSAGDDSTARIWDLGSYKLVHTLRGRSNNVRQLGLNATGQYGLFNNQWLLQVFRIPDGQLIANIEANGGRFSDVATFGPADARLVLAGNESKQLQLWQFRTDRLFPRLVRTYDGNVDEVNSVDFTPDGAYVISGGRDRSVRVYEVPSSKEIDRERKLGRIEFINDHVEGGSNTVNVSIEVKNDDNALLAGSFATVIIYPEEPPAPAAN